MCVRLTILEDHHVRAQVCQPQPLQPRTRRRQPVEQRVAQPVPARLDRELAHLPPEPVPRVGVQEPAERAELGSGGHGQGAEQEDLGGMAEVGVHKGEAA